LAGRVTPQISTSPCPVGPARQHRELNLARDLELALERQPVGDLEQHQQVHEDEADDQRERPVGPGRHEHRDLEERQAERDVHRHEAAEQPEEADERDDERTQVEDAPRGREAQCERDEERPDARRDPLPPRQPGVALLVAAAREEAVRLRGVAREEPLQVLGRESRACRCRTPRAPGRTCSAS
jgi:hypothetical protein